MSFFNRPCVVYTRPGYVEGLFYLLVSIPKLTPDVY